MITHSFYESDNRVIRYAETLAMRGDAVEVVALRSDASLPREEIINGVKLYRIQDRFGKTEKSKFSFLRPLLRFLIVSSRWLIRQHRRDHYDLLHVHNIPDFLVFAAWYPRLRGAKVILDIHDILPEFFDSKFGVSKTSALTWGLRQMEAVSAAMADHVILANELWLEKYTSRSAAKEKCSVFINYVDQHIFVPQRRTRTCPGPVVMFPGGLQWHQGLDIAIRAFGKLRNRLPLAELHIYGDGNMKPALITLSQQLGLSDSVRFFKPIPIHEIAGVMANADLGIVPKRADSFGNEAYSTKIMEFMALGVPLVVSSTKIDRHYFSDSVVRFFESGNDEAMADAMFEVLTNVALREGMVRRANEYVARNSWERHKARYLQLVDSLVAGTPVPVTGMGRI
jgi:glycosyltransferase involved in cell wall biosynthesis